jgi:hypothetical protein
MGHIVWNCPQVEVERKICDLYAQLAKLKLELNERANLVDEAYHKEAEEVTVNALCQPSR